MLTSALARIVRFTGPAIVSSVATTAVTLRFAASIFWRSSYAAQRSERDIVVLDDGRRELCRERPYNDITIRNPLDRIITEIKASGLDELLRVRHIELARLGPIAKPARVICGGRRPHTVIATGISDPAPVRRLGGGYSELTAAVLELRHLFGRRQRNLERTR